MRITSITVITLGLVTACGSSEGGRGGASDSATSGLTTAGGSSGSATGGGTTGAGGTSAGSASGGATSAATGAGGTSSGSDGGGFKFDLGEIPDAGNNCGGMGDVEFSYIWIANSSQNTVSKIDTRTLVEEGRYNTGPQGNPSRTSVNLDGDVAVVNRGGGITKIWAVPERCQDKNADMVINTSTGANDVLAWGAEECVAWNTPLPAGARPAAWTSGDKVGEDGCGNPIFQDAKVWSTAPGGGGSIVYLINGDTGAIENQVNVPAGSSLGGLYGGAVDADNDLWGVVYSGGPLVHVRISDLSFEIIPLPIASSSAYGFTVDRKGRSWVGGWNGLLHRYDPATQTWTQVPFPANVTSLNRGMMEDQKGHLWIASMNQGIVRVDTDTATFIELVDAQLPGGVVTLTGASVDVDGVVWVVDQSKNGGGAFVYDPVADTAQWFGGLVGPYTYSDMTGWALKNVANPSG